MVGCSRAALFSLFGFFLSACVYVDLPLPESTAGPDIYLKPNTHIVEDQVSRDATFATLLASHELGDVAHAFVEAMRPVFDPRALRRGHPYKLIFGAEGEFRRFEYHVDENQYLEVVSVSLDSAAPVFEAFLVDYEKELEQVAIKVSIDAEHNSLMAAMSAGGGHDLVAMSMAEVFAGEIDFNTELRLGDRFGVLYERFVRDDVHVTYGDVLAVLFEGDGREVSAFRFEVPGEEPAYFDGDGLSMKRQFLRSPLPFEPRITSRFSYRRLHPVLGVNRPHLGVDYGAPTGTRVIAVANGTVVSAARSGGSGNMVRLRHSNGYETWYLHLSRFANGMSPGARVRQGQTIGYVGSTGLATGPHLDYRVRKNGTFVNPLIEHRNMPPGEPVPHEHKVSFENERDRLLARLSSRQPGGYTPLGGSIQ